MMSAFVGSNLLIEKNLKWMAVKPGLTFQLNPSFLTIILEIQYK